MILLNVLLKGLWGKEFDIPQNYILEDIFFKKKHKNKSIDLSIFNMLVKRIK